MKQGASTNGHQATKLIESGFAAQTQGDPDRAWAAYQAALDCVPEHPTALQLMGLLARKRGDGQAAEDLMRRSLKVFPAQPHVWNNLGNVLDAAQRPEDALTCFEQAIALDDSYADAHYNRARLLFVLKRLPQAQAAAGRAAELSPQPRAALLQLQAQVQSELGQLQPAVDTLDRALSLLPASPPLLHNRAVLRQRLHRYAQALQDHEAALAAGLDAADAHYNHGNTLQSLGRLGDAVAAYRRALARQPLHQLALYDLARLRWRLGEADFDRELLDAASAHPQSSLAPSLHGHLLLRAERYADAAACFELALQRETPVAGFHDGLARALARLGRLDDSLAHHLQAVALAPADAALRTSQATTLLMARRADAAAVQAQAACALAPDDQSAWALLGLAWQLAGDPRATWLNDMARLVSVVDLQAPPGFADMATFNRALAQELIELHRDRAAPLDQTLRGGTQTLGDIFEQGHPLVDALKLRISQAITGYIAGLPDDPAHPFLRRRSKAWRFTDSWSSRLGSGGFHNNHVHPHGWISSACYVVVPDSVLRGDGQAGWLQFGEPDFDAGLSQAGRVKVQPRPGRLVLFPSMFWHGTVPFVDGTDRLTIAFDVMPD